MILQIPKGDALGWSEQWAPHSTGLASSAVLRSKSAFHSSFCKENTWGLTVPFNKYCTRFKVPVHILCHVSSIRHVNMGMNWILTSSVFHNEPQKSTVSGWIMSMDVNGGWFFPYKNPPVEVTSNEHTVFTWYVVIPVFCNMAQWFRIMSDWKGCRNYVSLKMRGANVQQDFLNRKKTHPKTIDNIMCSPNETWKKQQSTCKYIYVQIQTIEDLKVHQYPLFAGIQVHTRNPMLVEPKNIQEPSSPKLLPSLAWQPSLRPETTQPGWRMVDWWKELRNSPWWPTR